MTRGEQHPVLRAAVVGTGFGCLTHVRALRAAGFDVVALVGQDPERTAERAKRFDIPHSFTSLTAAVAGSGVDAVTIATPPHSHAGLVLESVAAGKHVVCEKPLARDAPEARALLAAAEAAGVVHLLGADFRWATAQALVARVVAEGAIGEPRLAAFLLHIPLLADPAASVPAWWSDTRQGGGWLGAHASHVIDQIRVTLGEFAGVSAALPQLADRAGDRAWTAEDTYTVHFRLDSGVEGVMQSTAADWGPIFISTRICGSRGTVWAEGDNVRLADRTGTREVPVPDDLRVPPAAPPPPDLLHSSYDLLHSTGIDVGPYTRLAEVFRDLINREPVAAEPEPATFADGVAGMAVIDAVRRSAAERAWVAVERDL